MSYDPALFTSFAVKELLEKVHEGTYDTGLETFLYDLDELKSFIQEMIVKVEMRMEELEEVDDDVLEEDDEE